MSTSREATVRTGDGLAVGQWLVRLVVASLAGSLTAMPLMAYADTEPEDVNAELEQQDHLFETILTEEDGAGGGTNEVSNRDGPEQGSEPAGVWVSYPVGGLDDEGDPCQAWAGTWVEDPDEAEAVRADRQGDFEAWGQQVGAGDTTGGYIDDDNPFADTITAEFAMDDLSTCPGHEDGSEGPQLDPQVVREAIVHQLVAPEPYVAPGWALTGMPAYLEINGALDYDDTITGEDIPVPVRVVGEARYEVAWGDGTIETVASTGGPYPDGDLTHAYTHSDEELVLTVTPRWEVTWSAVGMSVPLSIELPAEVLELSVRELQAVRTPNAGR